MTPERECAVVQDLLPLYRDGLLSAESVRFVEEHVARCPSCQALIGRVLATQSSIEDSREDSVRADVHTEGFLRRWRARRRLLALLALGCVVLAGALGALAAVRGQPSAQGRYRTFVDSVPGYATAVATGAVVPLAQTVRVGGETVTFKAFYATYLGSYLIFTVATAGRPPALPYLEAHGQSAPENAGVPTQSTAIAPDAAAGYWSLPGLQVPTPLSGRTGSTTPTQVLVKVSLGESDTARQVVLRIPASAYLPHGQVSLHRPATFSADGHEVRLDSLTMSSAGTLVRCAFRGAGPVPQLDFKGCPAFVAGQGCGTMATWNLPPKAGWQPFVTALGSPTAKALKARQASLPLKDLLVESTFAISHTILWPPKDLPGPGTKKSGVLLGRTAYGAVRLTAANPYALWIATTSRGRGQRIPPLQLQTVDLTLPGGATARAQVDALAETGAAPGPGLHIFGYEARASFEKPVAQALWQQPGAARIAFSIGTYTAHSFAKGQTWRP